MQSRMEDSIQTPLLHQLINVDDSDGVHATDEDLVLLNLTRLFSGLTINDSEVSDDVPPTAFSSPVAGTEVSADVPAAREDDVDRIVEERPAPPLVLPQPENRSRLYSQFVPPRSPNQPCLRIGEKTLSGVALIITLWFLACLTLTFGVYSKGAIRIGLGCSLLLQPNRLFAETINVEQSSITNSGPILYGFHHKPPLDVITTWSDTHHASLEADIHKDWMYILNEGSQINISYNVVSSSSLLLTVAQGSDGYGHWLHNRSFPNTTLSWNIIHGNGQIQQNISKSGAYYIAVGNLNSEMEEVQLNISARAFIYNTSEAYYMCMVAQGQCSIPLSFLDENNAVLTTPRLKQGKSDGEWHVRVTYGPRWSIYFGGSVVITIIMLVAINFIDKFGCICRCMGRHGSSRAPVVPYNYDDLLSRGSSYDSVSENGDDSEDEIMSHNGRPIRDGESSNNVGGLNLCAICFDAPRNCFFLPCGHSVACFACGTRIVEVAGTCPICRRRMKKVKKIYTS